MDAAGRTIPELTIAGSGLLLGDRVLTAAHVLPPRSGAGGREGTLEKVYVSPGVHRPIPSLVSFTNWLVASFDYHISSAIQSVDASVATMDVDGTRWAAGSDVAVLRLDKQDLPFLKMRARPLRGRMAQWFADPVCAGLGSAADHFVLGFPSVPDAAEGEDEVARLWHGQEPITAAQLRSALHHYETLILSRGTGPLLEGPTRDGRSDAGDCAESSDGSTPTAAARKCWLRPHFANSLAGMSGGPVVNSAGKVVGVHVGGREKSGAYNLYLGVDHPALRTAVEMITASSAHP